MKNKFLFRLLTVGMLSLGMVSCKKDDAPPANEISDASGIKASMNWTVTATTTVPAYDVVDIDMRLYKGLGANKELSSTASSTSSDTFEDFDLTTLSDGDYTLEVEYYDVQASGGTLNFSFSGKTVNKTYEVKGINFTTSMDGQTQDLVKIHKSGDKYTISKL